VNNMLKKMCYAFKWLFNKSFKYSPVVICQGNPQIGKSSIVWKIANLISDLKYGKEWNYEEFCAKSFEEFIELVDKYDNEVLVVEEAGFQISAFEWQNLQNRLFNQILQTQAYKHNIYILVLPHAKGIAKAHRRMIDMSINVIKKLEKHRINLIQATIYRKIYWKLEEAEYKPIFFPFIRVKFTKEELLKVKKYVDWLIGYKKDIMSEIKQKAKLIKNKS